MFDGPSPPPWANRNRGIPLLLPGDAAHSFGAFGPNGFELLLLLPEPVGLAAALLLLPEGRRTKIWG